MTWNLRRVVRKGLIVLLAVHIAILGFTVLAVRAIRHKPSPGLVITSFRAPWAFTLVARILLLKPGTAAYNSSILEWIYIYARPADDWLNRWLLARSLMRDFPSRVHSGRNATSQRQLAAWAELLAHYPVEPTQALLDFSKRAVLSGDVQFLSIVARHADGAQQEFIAKWVASYFQTAAQLPVLEVYQKLVFADPKAPAAKLLRLAWRNRKDVGGALWGMVDLALAASPQAINRQLDGFYALLDEMLHADPSIERRPVGAILARLATLPDGSARALKFVAARSNALTESELVTLVQAAHVYDGGAFAKVLYRKLLPSQRELAIAVFDGIARTDIAGAESLATPIWHQEDSSARKDMIVILINHDSLIAAPHIDEAFAGQFPRRRLFQGTYRYTTSSKAEEMYVRLAGHDYRQTGKTWPPSSVSGIPLERQAQRWREFIDQYPWFPGTDDAFYRLGFIQYRLGLPDAALATIREYFSVTERPDRDADPYIDYLLLHVLAEVEPQADSPYSQLQALARTNLSSGALEESPALQDFIDACEWLAADPERLRYVPDNRFRWIEPALSTQHFQLVHDAAVIAQNRPLGERLFAIVSLLAGRRVLQESPHSLQEFLYAVDFMPEAPRAEYAPPELSLSTDNLALPAQVATTQDRVRNLFASEQDPMRRFDLFIWSVLHARAKLHPSFDALTPSADVESTLESLSSNAATQSVLNALRIGPR